MNRYFVCLPSSREARAWSPHDAADVPIDDCRYLGKVLGAFERRAASSGLTIYLTWDVSWLPSYGPNVVAIVLGDEWCRVPTYAHRVRAVFKSYGVRRAFDWKPKLDAEWFASFLQEARIAVARMPLMLASRVRTIAGRPARIYDIPLGYLKQLDVPIVPIAERRYDVFFAGSIEHRSFSKFSLRRLARTPKVLSRERMFAVMLAYRERAPERKVELRTTADFQASARDDGESYSKTLAQTKLCLVPRGASAETFRWFEGLRAGCVVVCEPLPHRRYYDGAPVITLDRWDALPAMLDRLLSDPHELERLHRASRRWWDERCGEEVTGAFIAEHV